MVTQALAGAALDLLQIDDTGLDKMDIRYLQTLIEHFSGGPAGVDSLATALGEDKGTLEDVLEPYLIQQGFIQRTTRGRVANAIAYSHLGIDVPEVLK